MVYGFNLSQCIKCGKHFVCGDCIDFICDDCRTKKILVEMEEREKNGKSEKNESEKTES